MLKDFFYKSGDVVRIVVQYGQDRDKRLYEIDLRDKSIKIYTETNEIGLNLIKETQESVSGNHDAISETDNSWYLLNDNKNEDKNYIREAIAILHFYEEEANIVNHIIKASKNQWKQLNDDTVPSLCPHPYITVAGQPSVSHSLSVSFFKLN